MGPRRLLITEHLTIREGKGDVLGYIRRRTSPSGKVDYWEVRQAVGVWDGRHKTREEAERVVRDGK